MILRFCNPQRHGLRGGGAIHPTVTLSIGLRDGNSKVRIQDVK